MTVEQGMSGDLMPGANVYTSDGDELGTVKEVMGGFFKVDAAMRPDYWLRTDCIRTASAGQVQLMIDKKHIGDFKVADPRKG